MNMAWKALLIAVVIASATWIWSANQETTNGHRELLPSAVLVKEAPPQADQPIDWDAIATGKPTSGHCVKWASFKESAAFKALSKENQEASRNLYFDECVSPHVPAEDIGKARREFDEYSKPSWLDGNDTAAIAILGIALIAAAIGLIAAMWWLALRAAPKIQSIAGEVRNKYDSLARVAKKYRLTIAALIVLIFFAWMFRYEYLSTNLIRVDRFTGTVERFDSDGWHNVQE